MKIVFDLDDTICRTINRDYVNSEEIVSVVSKMREIRESLPDTEIVVHTARGMASCHGDAKAAEEKNRQTIMEWLQRHNIHVDEIIFGKPFADIYVDDKGMSAEEFANSDIETFYGFSGAKVIRIGRIVVKECDNANIQAEWYRKAAEHYKGNGAFRIPHIHSATLGKLFMEYVDGIPAVNVVDDNLIRDILHHLQGERTLQGENDITSYADYVNGRANAIGLKTDIRQRLMNCRMLKQRTFCHGDLSLQNIICTHDGIALIDPSPKDKMDSWMLDAAKLRASLNVLDEVLAGVSHPKRMVYIFDENIRGKNVLQEIQLLEESHIIRVWYYAKKLGKIKQEKQLEAYYKEHYGK